MTNIRALKRKNRHQRIAKKVRGTTERMRLCVHRSLKNIQAHVVDDVSGKVICGLSTHNKELRSKLKSGGNVHAASVLGEALAKVAKEKGISRVCFDRGGFRYHGRIKAFAEAARKNGLEF